MDWDVDDQWQKKSSRAWRKLDTSAFISSDASEFELGDVLVSRDQKQFSQELQFQFDNSDGLEAVFGLYYLNEKVPAYQEAYADDFLTFMDIPIDFLRTIEDDLDTKSYAAFGHFIWSFVIEWCL